MTNQQLVQIVAEALAATALRTSEHDPMGGVNWRYYTLSLDSRTQHVRRAEEIVDRIQREGFSVERSN